MGKDIFPAAYSKIRLYFSPPSVYHSIMISRTIESTVQELATQFSAVTITGPRQSGKSTLCKKLFPSHPYANLEEMATRSFAADDPKAFLGQYPNGAVIDEVQRCPELLSYLQGIIDANPAPGQWILTGSQNLLLLESVSQSLAGRTAVVHLLPLGHEEVLRFDRSEPSLDEMLLTGGYPSIYDRDIPPANWYSSYVSTYIERDVRTITNVGDLMSFQRFLSLCAGRTGQLLNMASLADDAGISQPTAKSWLSILETSFLTFRLLPYHSNHRKRLVKMPKLHFYDTGLVCWLLGIRTVEQLRNHPLRGSIFETWVVSEVIKSRMHHGENRPCYYFRTKAGQEADMVVEHAGGIRVLEAKAGETLASDMLRMTARTAKSITETLPVDPYLVYGGASRQNRSEITALPWRELAQLSWADQE